MSRPPRLSSGLVFGIGLLGAAYVAANDGNVAAFAVAVLGAGFLGAGASGPDERGLRRTGARSVATVAGAVLLVASLVSVGLSGAPVVWTLCVGTYGLVLYTRDALGEDELLGQLAYLAYAFAIVLAASVLVAVGAALPGGVLTAATWLVDGATWLATRYVFGYLGMLAIAGAAIVGLTRRAITLTPVRAMRPEEDVADAVDSAEERLARAERVIPRAVTIGVATMVLGPVVGFLLTVTVGVPIDATLSPVPGGTLQGLLWSLVALLSGYVVVGSILRRLWRSSGHRVVTHGARGAGGLVAVPVAAAAAALQLPRRLLLAVPSTVARDALDVVESIGGVQSVLLVVLVATVIAGGTLFVVLVLSIARVLPERAGGAALGSASLVVAALGTATWPAVVVGMASALFVWDVGEHAATLAEQVGRGAATTRNELVHAGGNAVVGIGAVGVGTGTAAVAGSIGRPDPASATVAIISLLAGALVLASLLRASRWGR